ncbi:hypothetical protein [Aureibacter tunicatorum]|uniref:Uncharacterized protein n=1 Tax=Aureibacter tunicatorum TaxID=866807 RepID=A0AAE3XMM5_9BACT|nr:hypothetical protein [Aureibacter tunicatorum]MDR6240711.1 hypothetical protein [Aureibacter tunicatorum]BDD06956.1 hypothetical protein AUTU_44390 [Aureibacter tunicatorum]
MNKNLTLNEGAFVWAMELISSGKINKEGLSFEKLSKNVALFDEIIEKEGIEFYKLWFLGINEDVDPKSRDAYIYPIGDFNFISLSALLAIRELTTVDHYYNIEKAADKLLKALDH